jgi:hypothetical protein
MVSFTDLSYGIESLIFVSGISFGLIFCAGFTDEKLKKMKLIKRIPFMLLIWIVWHIVLPAPAYILAYVLEIIINNFS